MKKFIGFLGGITIFCHSAGVWAQSDQPAVAPTAAQGEVAQPSPTPKLVSLEEEQKRLDAAVKKLETTREKLDKITRTLESNSKESEKKKDELQLRLPWNGFGLTLGDKDKKAQLILSWPLFDGNATLKTDFTVPLDEDTRRAALLDRQGNVSPFQAKVSIDWNVMGHALWKSVDALKDQRSLCDAYMKEKKLKGVCPEQTEEFKNWVTEQKAALSIPASIDGAFSRRVPDWVKFTVGLEFAGTFDRQKFYGNDVSVKPTERNKWSFSASAVARFYPGKHWTLPLRAGLEVNDGLEASEFERCSNLTGSASITGQKCKKALILDEEKGAHPVGFTEIGLIRVFDPIESANLALALDLRVRVEGIGNSKLGHAFITGLALPTDQPFASRFGLGVDLVYALDDDDASSPEYEKGDTWFTPFFLVGGSI